MPDLEIELATYFKKSFQSIDRLNEYRKDREDVLRNIPRIWKNPTAANAQIDRIALDLAGKSLQDEITGQHVALIELLNQEINAWNNLKSAIAAQNKEAIDGFLSLLRKLLAREARLMPLTARAQAVFVKMTPEQMRKAAAAPV